ncbi:MAG: hypothetical protein ACYSWU_27305 [Planctomycetota bacterium]|jgi:hypothetical protein
MTKIDFTGKGSVRRQTCVLDPASKRPICVEVGPHYLTFWLHGTRQKLSLHLLAAYQAAAKAEAGFVDPPADRKRRRLRRR